MKVKSRKTMNTENPFVEKNQEERIEAKRERTEARAERAEKNASALHAQAKSMASGIPFGQPILVGHHSETRDRNYRGKITSKFDKSFQELDKADHLRSKADTIGTGGISSTAPTALTELQNKLEVLEGRQAMMKATNAEFRKGGIEGVKSLSDAQIEELKNNMAKSWRSNDKPFAGFELTNNNAKIRNTKKRIEEISTMRESEALEIERDDYKLFIDEGRLQIEFFSGKPSDEARKVCKSYAFKWSRYSSTWVRKVTGNAIHAAKRAAADLDALESIY